MLESRLFEFVKKKKCGGGRGALVFFCVVSVLSLPLL